jgi:PAS domain S-box-containing protein
LKTPARESLFWDGWRQCYIYWPEYRRARRQIAKNFANGGGMGAIIRTEQKAESLLASGPRPKTVTIVCGVASIVLAIAAGLWQHHSNQSAFDERYRSLTSEFADLVNERFRLYQYGLRGARGAIVAGGGVATSRRTFESYFKTRDQFVEFPGSRGVGYIARVAPGNVETFVTAARADGFPAFVVRELSPNKGERFIIQFIYPLKGNEGATGLDIASEANRRNAAEDAAQAGQVRLTAPITLVQASGKTNHGFLILMPVYDIGLPTDTPKTRLAANIGWSYSPLVVSEVLRDFGPRRDEIAFSLTDTGTGTEFYKSPGYAVEKVHSTREVVVFGRHWKIRFHVLPAFHKLYAPVDGLLVGVGIAWVGMLLTLAMFGFLKNRERAWQIRRDEEAFAYNIVDAAPEALLVVDDAGMIVRANSFCEQVFGWSARELVGRSVEDLIPERHRAAHRAHRATYDHRLRGMGTDRRLEALRADGTVIPILARLAPLRLGAQKLVVAGISDVSVEHEAFQVLTASQQRWQEMANSLPQLVWTCDASGACDFLSDQWVQYTGIPAEAQLGEAWLEQVHPDDHENLISTWTKSVETKSSFLIEFRIRRHDGVYRLFYTRAEPILDEDGNVQRWIGSNTDIEDRHQAEQQVRALLAELEDRVSQRTIELNTALRDLQNVLDAVPSMIAYWDKDLKNQFANKAYEKWFGVTAEWLKGRHIKELLGDELYAKNGPCIEGALRGQVQNFERELVDPNGKIIASQAHYLPDIENGEVQGFYVLVFDISAVKASERAEKKARDAADAANRTKSEFLATMSHEIRTPMTGVMGFADLLLEDDLAETSREKVYRIKEATSALLRIIEDILDISKLEVGKFKLEYRDFNLPALIEEVVGMFSEKRYGPRASHVEIIVDLSDDFPVGVHLDPTRMRQLLVNLVGNARKFTEKGSIRVIGRLIEKESETPELRIEIKDTGIGIKPEAIDALFDAFSQADASISRRFQGTGLGLSICKKLVELMQGRIGVESTHGVGSTFWFTLPFVAAEGEVTADKSSAVPAARYRATRPLHVLVVDDNSLNQRIVGGIMTVLGHTFVLAENGMEAIKRHEGGAFDLILMDIRMPVMSGIDATRLIRGMPGEKGTVPIVALTADAMEENRKTYIAAGMNGVVTKPIDLSILAKTMNEVIGEEINIPIVSMAKQATVEKGGDDDANMAAIDDFLHKIEGEMD